MAYATLSPLETMLFVSTTALNKANKAAMPPTQQKFCRLPKYSFQYKNL